jgi:hypothetical protein
MSYRPLGLLLVAPAFAAEAHAATSAGAHALGRVVGALLALLLIAVLLRWALRRVAASSARLAERARAAARRHAEEAARDEKALCRDGAESAELPWIRLARALQRPHPMLA